MPAGKLKNPRKLALWAVWLYGISMGAELLDHFWNWLPRELRPETTPYDSFPEDDASLLGADHHDTYYLYAGLGLLEWVMLVSGVASAIIYLIWKYRAATNARILDASAMTVSPAMAVGSYFIPIAFFVIPYRAMAGISRATLGDTSGVGLWWGCHVGLVLSGIAIGEMTPMAGPGLLDHLYMVGSLITFLISIWLVLRITRAQAALCQN